MACRWDCGFRACGGIVSQRGQEPGPRSMPRLFFALVPYSTSTVPEPRAPRTMTTVRWLLFPPSIFSALLYRPLTFFDTTL
jgi:hypothetical protein